MTTKISKILTIFVTIASVAFMAVIIGNANGPNWDVKAKELKEVAFDRASPGAPWTAKRRSDSFDLGGGPILPAAIVAAQRKLKQEEDTTLAALQAEITKRNSAITEAQAQITADIDAMKRRQADLDKQFTELQAQLAQVAQDYTQEAKREIDDLDILQLRKDEFVRLKNQLEELRAQRQAATDELDRLKALTYQATANLERVKERKKSLDRDIPYDQGGPQENNQKAPQENK